MDTRWILLPTKFILAKLNPVRLSSLPLHFYAERGETHQLPATNRTVSIRVRSPVFSRFERGSGIGLSFRKMLIYVYILVSYMHSEIKQPAEKEGKLFGCSECKDSDGG